jgi:hypothetical protein
MISSPDYLQIFLVLAALSGAYLMVGVLVADAWFKSDWAMLAGAAVWPLLAAVVLPYVITRWFINLRTWNSHTDPDGET